MKDFHFYLDAWQYCHQNKIDLKFITRLDWKTWRVAKR